MYLVRKNLNFGYTIEQLLNVLYDYSHEDTAINSLTAKLFILLAKTQTSRVVLVLLKIASFKLLSNFTFAAMWNITETLSINICLSVGSNPKPTIAASPIIGTSLSKLDGCSVRNSLNNYNKNRRSLGGLSIIARSNFTRCFFGRIQNSDKKKKMSQTRD